MVSKSGAEWDAWNGWMDIACMLALEAARMEPSREDETKRILIVNVDKEKKQGCQYHPNFRFISFSFSFDAVWVYPNEDRMLRAFLTRTSQDVTSSVVIKYCCPWNMTLFQMIDELRTTSRCMCIYLEYTICKQGRTHRHVVYIYIYIIVYGYMWVVGKWSLWGVDGTRRP